VSFCALQLGNDGFANQYVATVKALYNESDIDVNGYAELGYLFDK
jgi:hypothetical protein